MKLVEFKHQRSLTRTTRRPLRVRKVAPVLRFGTFVYRAEIVWGHEKVEIVLVD